MIDQIVFWGLCAILVFVPLPIGSVEEWSIFAFEAATISLFLLYAGGRLFGRRRRAAEPGAEADETDRLAGRLPGLIKVLLAVFAVLAALQLKTLPAGLVKVLSPRAYEIHAGLVRDAVTAPASWIRLSLAPAATVYELVLIACYGLFGYLVLRTLRTRGRAEILVVVILASALGQAVYGMAETFSGHEMILGRPKRYGLGSVTGTFVNRNHLAGFLEMAFPLSLGYLLVKARYFAMEKGMSLRRRILWFGQESLQWTLLLGLVPLFIGVGLIFTKSRSGLMVLAVTAVLGVVAAAMWRDVSAGEGRGRGKGEGEAGGGGTGRRFGRILRLVVAAVLAAAVWIGIGPVLQRFSEVDLSAAARRTIYKNTLEMIGDFPWTGTGRGTFVNAYPMYEKVDDRLRLSFAHNDYLETFAEQGLVAGGALVAVGIALLVWLAAAWRRRRSPFAKGIGLGALLGVAALLIHGFTDFNLQITANAVYFTAVAMLGAAVLSKPRPDRPAEKPPRRKTASPIGRLGLVIAAVLAAGLLLPAVRDFLGFQNLADYRRDRSRARSVESAFPALEARLARAAAVSPLAVFQVEAARLDMEMARVANESGRDEDRDTLCDRAVARYGQAIAANPLDAAVHYEMGTAYLLYNFPLMTYQERARAYFRQALIFKPADETINLNVQFLYFGLWTSLDDADKAYAAGLYRAMLVRDPDFPAKLEARWSQSYGAPDALRAILAGLPR